MGQRQRISSNKPWIKKIDFIFYNEKEIRLAVLEARNTGKPLCEVPSKNASGVSDPTARDAMYNLTPLPTVRINGQDLRLPERWLTVIDKTYAWAEADNKLRYKVAKLKYSGENYKAICMECHISMKHQYLLLEKFRMYAVDEARELKLIDREEFKKFFS